MKEISGFPNYYIDPTGRVFREMKSKPGSNGYKKVTIRSRGKKATINVHRLVAKVFIPQPSPDKNYVNHKNGVKTDNRAENLEWVTAGDNQRHAYATGLMSRLGSKNSQAVLNENQVRHIKGLLADGMKAREISEQMGVSVYLVKSIKYGWSWKHVL